jgi:CRP-like cAMP-binding protein
MPSEGIGAKWLIGRCCLHQRLLYLDNEVTRKSATFHLANPLCATKRAINDMKESLRHRLKAVDILTDLEIANGLNYFAPKSFEKGSFLIETGNICNWMAFVNSGVLRNFYISSKDEEVTYCLTFPNMVLSAFSSFITQRVTFENIHALTNVELLLISRNQYDELINSSRNWLKFSKFIAEQSYIEMEKRLISLQMESAKKRYEDLLQFNPDYLQTVPLKYLASYLGITQRHLSRLRREISF